MGVGYLQFAVGFTPASSEIGDGGVQAGFYRAKGNAQCLTDVPVGKLAEVCEGQNLAKVGRHPLHNISNALANFALFKLVARHRMAGFGQVHRRQVVVASAAREK